MESVILKRLFSFLEKDPNDAFALYAIAYEYAKAGQHDQAIKYFLELKDKHPDYVGLYYHLGKSFELTGKADDAEKSYREGMKVARQQGEFHPLSELQGALNQLLGLDFEE